MTVVDFRLVPPEPEDNDAKTLAAIWEAAFEKFWPAYPRRVNKLAAFRAWKAQRPKKREQFEGHFKQIMRLLRYFKNEQWDDRPLDRIPHAATWLNAQSFEPADVDEVCR